MLSKNEYILTRSFKLKKVLGKAGYKIILLLKYDSFFT